jgi:formylglycine-generating enzyme required for sulfatase activity
MAYAAWDTALSLRLNSEELVFNDDYYGMNARIQYTLPSDGTYEIVVSGYYERDGGTYTLRVESSIYSTATPAVTVTAQSPTEMPDAIITAMAGLVRPDKIFTPTPETEEQLPTTPIMHNSDWMPVERDFNSIPFILVPAGCFMMGSEGGQDNEQPMHEQCFDVPFWIGKTEVTQADFERLGGMKANSNGYTGNANPVENITWFESQSFCEGLGGSLPTEAEWEYAARGPESFVYPWGNNYDATLVIGRDDPTYGFPNGSRVGTAPVGSRTAGASWVGALDMAGNVWEWTLSGFEPYPYVTGDGRNDTQDSIGDRVLRGGSFGDVNNDLRSAYRFNWFNDYYFSIGFRCVVSEEVSDDGNSDR